ncbi:hypothetical protein MKZ38_001685 [Zalerion maritima]|uniref:Uncharacterized protein n=1 Tax=Zalerion maritima TaxID=339359 RepID=A0AAD5RXP3_9PEZI|nr:hypothetical protein MKZ38_001685 [Zalerion maritima]
MACAARKPFFFGLWALVYVPFILSFPVVALGRSFITRVSAHQIVTLVFLLVNAALLEFYLLFRFAQSLNYLALCRGTFRCRRAGSSARTTSKKNSDIIATSVTQCPYTNFLIRTEDTIHATPMGQITLLVLSITNVFLFSAIFFALYMQAPEGSLGNLPKPFGCEVLQKIIGYGTVILAIVGTASFIPYLAFRAVMAVGYICRPYGRRYGMSRGTREEEGKLLDSNMEKV